MIGNKLNKTKKQKGQVLLLVIMLLSTVLTVILASSFHSITETQTTKLEEESQKALAAAEAGIEAALKRGSVDIANLEGFEGSGFTGSATIQTLSSTNFITPLLQKDEQYTLYLSTPQGAPDNPDFTNLINPYSGNLTVCFNNVAIEITMIKTDNTVSRYAINPVGQTIIKNGLSANNGSANCPDTSFTNYYTLNINPPNNLTKLLIVRVIGNNSTKIGFRGSTNLPLQGKTIISQATSPGGATKKVTLFQSYPQIPTDFFVTSF